MRTCSFSEFVAEAIKYAKYEHCNQTESWTASVEEFPGCWAQAETVEAARQELLEVIEGWLLLGIRAGDKIPPIGNKRLGLPEVTAPRALALTH